MAHNGPVSHTGGSQLSVTLHWLWQMHVCMNWKFVNRVLVLYLVHNCCLTLMVRISFLRPQCVVKLPDESMSHSDFQVCYVTLVTISEMQNGGRARPSEVVSLIWSSRQILQLQPRSTTCRESLPPHRRTRAYTHMHTCTRACGGQAHFQVPRPPATASIGSSACLIRNSLASVQAALIEQGAAADRPLPQLHAEALTRAALARHPGWRRCRRYRPRLAAPCQSQHHYPLGNAAVSHGKGAEVPTASRSVSLPRKKKKHKSLKD